MQREVIKSTVSFFLSTLLTFICVLRPVSSFHILAPLNHHRKDLFCAMSSDANNDPRSTLSRPDLIRKLLKGIETGDPDAAAVVNENKYIQHNPQTHEGGEGLAALFARLSKTNPHVNIVRAFEDPSNDMVFGHTEYDFSTRRIGFEVFLFDEDNYAVEHWDNIQPRKGPNPSGRSMVDGPTEATNLEDTETNRSLIQSYVQDVLISQDYEKLSNYVAENLIQHDPFLVDGRDALLKDLHSGVKVYNKLHRVLARGNFVLAVCEGEQRHQLENDDGDPSSIHASFYHLHRVEEGRIVEHWDTIEAIPPQSEWKNQNGKF